MKDNSLESIVIGLPASKYIDEISGPVIGCGAGKNITYGKHGVELKDVKPVRVDDHSTNLLDLLERTACFFLKLVWEKKGVKKKIIRIQQEEQK